MDDNQLKSLPHVTDCIAQWHHDAGIIEGSDDQLQCFKMHEEMVELFCACHPDLTNSQLWRMFNANTARLYGMGKFQTVPLAEAQDAKEDAVGDMVVVGISMLERAKTSLRKCLNGVYDIISKRLGKGKMIGGCFIKEEGIAEKDLPE